jgi:hypothetical protein
MGWSIVDLLNSFQERMGQSDNRAISPEGQRYLIYAGRMTNQHARAAIVDRALECIRLAEAAEPHCTAAKRTIEAVRLAGL